MLLAVCEKPSKEMTCSNSSFIKHTAHSTQKTFRQNGKERSCERNHCSCLRFVCYIRMCLFFHWFQMLVYFCQSILFGITVGSTVDVEAQNADSLIFENSILMPNYFDRRSWQQEWWCWWYAPPWRKEIWYRIRQVGRRWVYGLFYTVAPDFTWVSCWHF